jgi:hypothetical protein
MYSADLITQLIRDRRTAFERRARLGSIQRRYADRLGRSSPTAEVIVLPPQTLDAGADEVVAVATSGPDERPTCVA